jgi:hypothetical protein
MPHLDKQLVHRIVRTIERIASISDFCPWRSLGDSNPLFSP